VGHQVVGSENGRRQFLQPGVGVDQSHCACLSSRSTIFKSRSCHTSSASNCR
jgi:hypothetical protein